MKQKEIVKKKLLSLFKKIPTDRGLTIEDLKNRGRRREIKIYFEKEPYEQVGCKIHVFPIEQHHDVDMLVYVPTDKGDVVIEALEITNFGKKTKYGKPIYLKESRAKDYIKHFKKYPYADHIVVVSFETNLTPKVKKLLKVHGVEIQVRGCQD